MKRTILITMLTAAGMFAQSTPATPPSSTTKTASPAPAAKKAKKAKSTTAKQVVNKKTPAAAPASSSAPVKQ